MFNSMFRKQRFFFLSFVTTTMGIDTKFFTVNVLDFSFFPELKIQMDGSLYLFSVGFTFVLFILFTYCYVVLEVLS